MTQPIIFYIVCVLFWWFSAIIFGMIEAWYFHAKMQTTMKVPDEHPVFTLQRALIALIMCLGTAFLFQSITKPVILGICLIMTFPWWHDGSYYCVRNVLDKSKYKKRWFAHSTTSTAKSEKFLTPLNRTIGFVAGTILSIINLFI